jgi:hypothetical protein
MGLEAQCTVRIGRKTSAGVAYLESERLIFRGDFRLDMPYGTMRDVSTDGGALVVKTDEQEARFDLGPAVADRWMRLIKEPKSLFEKLEVGSGSRVAVVDVYDAIFLTALRERTASVAEGRVPEGAPVIFFGAEAKDALRKIQLLRARMIDKGVLWIVRPKGSKAITESDVMEAIRMNGLIDTKVVAFSKTHTAHKCVIPEELRGKAIPRPPIVSIPPSAPALGNGPGPSKAKLARAPARPNAVRSAARAAPKKKSSTAKGKSPKKKKR